MGRLRSPHPSPPLLGDTVHRTSAALQARRIFRAGPAGHAHYEFLIRLKEQPQPRYSITPWPDVSFCSSSRFFQMWTKGRSVVVSTVPFSSAVLLCMTNSLAGLVELALVRLRTKGRTNTTGWDLA